jgi:hypothetical protein
MVQGLGSRVWGSGFRVQGLGLRVPDLGFRVGFRVHGLNPKGFVYGVPALHQPSAGGGIPEPCTLNPEP